MCSAAVSNPEVRIASIQHGDYLPVRERLAAGGTETYGSQRYSVEALDALLVGSRHLVISLDGPESSRTVESGRYVTCPALTYRWLPRRLSAELRCRQVLRELDAFAPTHLLIRTNDILGCRLLAWSQHHDIPTAVILASRFDPDHPPALEFCRLANHPNVLFVGNHNQVATDSLIACGLRPEKAVAWDFPPRITPESQAVKSMDSATPRRVLFAGNMIEAKGGADVVAAVALLRKRGEPVELAAFGEGPLRASLQAHAGVDEGWLKVPGQISIDELQDEMRRSWLVVVPTRPNFPEALPLTLVDALATRTPLVLSDHPVFKNYFTPGRAVDFFAAADASALADTILRLSADPARYRQYSEQTAAVWAELQIPVRFHDLLDRFAQESGLSGARA